MIRSTQALTRAQAAAFDFDVVTDAKPNPRGVAAEPAPAESARKAEAPDPSAKAAE